MARILFILLFLYSFNLLAQPNHIYTDIKQALKTPEKVFQLDLTLQSPKKSELRKISKFQNLEKLNLSFCNITSFPKRILNCSKLKYLNLKYNSLSSIPIEFSKLIELEELITSVRHKEKELNPHNKLIMY